MSEEEDLRKAICARPDEDAERLVLADLLQQRGDPYGEFIAVQCALARPESPDRAALLSRERALWAAHGASWCASLGVDRSQVTFTRGFPSELRLPLEIPKDLPARVGGQPWQSLSIEHDSNPEDYPEVIDLFGAMSPRKLLYQRVTLSERVSGKDPVLAGILTSEGVSCLREIDIALFLFSDVEDLFSMLAENRSTGALEVLRYNARPSHQSSLMRLLSSKACEGLKEIELGSGQRSSNEPMAPTLRALPPSVRALGVDRGVPEDSDAISERPFESLRWGVVSSPERLSALLRGRGELRSLSLRGCGLDETHIGALRGLSSLQSLVLAVNRLDGAAVVKLAEELPAAGLDSLDLSSNRGCLSTARACEVLARRLGHPRSLRAEGTGLDASGIQILADSGALSSLTTLSLATLEPSAARCLAEASPGLVSLKIDRIDPETVYAIGDTIGKRLEKLHLRRELSESAAHALVRVELPLLSSLSSLLGISAEAASVLRGAPWLSALAHARLPLHARGSPR